MTNKFVGEDGSDLQGAAALLLATLPRSHAAAAHCAVSLSTPSPLVWGCRYCAQACGKSVRVAVQALLAGPSSWVSKEDLEWYEKEAKHRAFMEKTQAIIDGYQRRKEEREQHERLAAWRSPNALSLQPQI